MPHALRLASPALLALIALLYGLGHYGSRSVLFPYLSDMMGLQADEIHGWFTQGAMWTMLGIGLGVPIALAAGPLPTLAAGLALAAAGWILMALTETSPMLSLGLTLTGIGMGAARPALIVAAVRWFGQGWESARLAALFAVYGAVNLGAMGGPFLMSHIRDSFGYTPIFFIGAGALALASLLAIGAFGLSFALPIPTGPKSTEAWAPGAIGVGLTTAIFGGQALAIWVFASDQQMMSLYPVMDVPEWLYMVNPVVVLGVCALGVVAGVAAQALGVRIPAHALAGLGMLAIGLGLLPTVGLGSMGLVGVAAVFTVSAIGEALLMPALWSASVGAVQWRLAAVPAAMLVAATTLTGLVGNLAGRFFDFPNTAALVSTGLAGGMALAGVIFLAAAWPARIATDRWGAPEGEPTPDADDGTAA